MTLVNDPIPWRASVVAALKLLAHAAARLPLGVPDPMLSGASAVELYTGGLGSTPDIEVVCADVRPLMVELFAAGFRWIPRPNSIGRELRHRELQVVVDLIARGVPLGAAEQSNTLTITIDVGPAGPAATEPVSLKVVGIEDLIVQQVDGWLRDRTAVGEAAAKLQALVGLAREGVGGPLRSGYRQRRLAWETDGEVVYEGLGSREGEALTPQLRRMCLKQMQMVISGWRDRCRLSVGPRRLKSDRRVGEAQAGVIRGRNDGSGRAGGSGSTISSLILRRLGGARSQSPRRSPKALCNGCCIAG